MSISVFISVVWVFFPFVSVSSLATWFQWHVACSYGGDWWVLWSSRVPLLGFWQPVWHLGSWVPVLWEYGEGEGVAGIWWVTRMVDFRRKDINRMQRKKNPPFCCIQEIYLNIKGRHYLRIRAWKFYKFLLSSNNCIFCLVTYALQEI